MISRTGYLKTDKGLLYRVSRKLERHDTGGLNTTIILTQGDSMIFPTGFINIKGAIAIDTGLLNI